MLRISRKKFATWGNLGVGGFFRYSCCGVLSESSCAHRLLAALSAVGVSLGASDYVDDDTTAVLATRRACTMILTKLTAFACYET